ncbi:hypothetical protein QR98_0045380 [Sarcoptes scabiei]|uniref:Uncharacterized protein n=1 Tax=Sarcoptes scabiei TaxID=52283 RepID=A0A132A613_SARSC|nr:hypothetical protein QR98_0045380 [Sarcoptes scabiei]
MAAPSIDSVQRIHPNKAIHPMSVDIVVYVCVVVYVAAIVFVVVFVVCGDADDGENNDRNCSRFVR